MFTDQQRTIFGPYFNGQEEVYGDPLKIHRRLCHALGGDPNAVIAEANKGDNDARERVLDAAGWSLEMVPFDKRTGQGATEEVVDQALRQFLEWLEGNAQRAGSYLTCSRPTVTESWEEGSSPTLSGPSST